MNTKRKQKETYPAIPENCERFRQDDIGRWEFQYPGIEYIDYAAEWDLVDAIYELAGPDHESGLLWRDLCNAARCAWLDEAERIILESATPEMPVCDLLFDYHWNVRLWHRGKGIHAKQWEKDHAEYLAHAEAWAREASGE